MRQHCEKIADGPHHYVTRPDLGDAMRICAHGNYLIVFEPFDDGALNIYVYRSQASGCDAKSDGGKFLSVLFLSFTVKPVHGMRETHR